MIGYGLSVIGVLGFTAFLIWYSGNMWWVLFAFILLPSSSYIVMKDKDN